MFHNTFSHAFSTLYYLSLDFLRFLGSLLQSRSVLAAENLFLQKQLALYQERQVQPRRATDATRLTMVSAARLFDWKKALVSVGPETFIAWHRRLIDILSFTGGESWPTLPELAAKVFLRATPGSKLDDE
jgi:putative transposase